MRSCINVPSLSCLLSSLLILVTLQSCNSPFHPEQDYKPELVVYGIAFRGDSTLAIRVDTNSKTQLSDSSSSGEIAGLHGIIVNELNLDTLSLSREYDNGLNVLVGKIYLASKTPLFLQVGAPGYSTCSASLTVLDSGLIYPAYFTTDVLRDPTGPGQPAPQFTIYPSSRTTAIRLTLSLIYQGIGNKGLPVSGEIDLNPSYQSDTTSYLLLINGATTGVDFNLSDYSYAYSEAVGELNSGTITAVVRLLQIDAPLYDFYSISNGFNDPLTMRTEKPVYTNVTNGLGFFGSAAEDSLAIQVYP